LVSNLPEGKKGWRSASPDTQEAFMFHPIRALEPLKSLFEASAARKVLSDVARYCCVASIIAMAWPFFSSEANLDLRTVVRTVVLLGIAATCLVASAFLAVGDNEKLEETAAPDGAGPQGQEHDQEGHLS
jgi:hypothetical protein